jgi:orotate phosphoribosyltransferase
MALGEHEKQDLVVGLYDRGEGLESQRRILDIGTSKILKSGIWSPYLVNLRPALSVDSQSVVSREDQTDIKNLLLQSMAEELCNLSDKVPFDHIFGLPEAGTPLAAAVSGAGGDSLLWQRVKPKEGYGSHQTLEGVYFKGQSVALVDDVATSGGTAETGVEFLTSNGLIANGMTIFFDREQGGAEAIKKTGLTLYSVIGATASFGYLLDGRRITKVEHDYLVDYTNNPAPTSEPASHPWKQS